MAEMLRPSTGEPGLIQAVDFGGCEGPQSPMSNVLNFEVDLI